MAQGARPANVGDVDDGDTRGPPSGIHLVAAAHGMMQAVLGPLRMRRLAGRGVLSRHPPARDLDRLRRTADVVDDENVTDEPVHLSRDIGVALVDIEAVHALAM